MALNQGNLVFIEKMEEGEETGQFEKLIIQTNNPKIFFSKDGLSCLAKWERGKIQQSQRDEGRYFI
jgi:hypothetical protein